MKRRLLLTALILSPVVAIADSFSSRGAGDKRRMRDLEQQFRDNKQAMQQGELKEEKKPAKGKTDTADPKKPAE